MEVEDLEEGGLYALLGSAGSGKSYTLKKLMEVPNLIKATSTTGISAVNLAGENTSVTTINSALKYFDAESLKRGIIDKSVTENLKKIAKYYRFIAIDEISMMSSTELDLIVYAVSLVNQQLKGRKLGILVVGDIHQLAPVGSFVTEGETKSFGKPFFLASSWSSFKCFYLTEIKRQTDKEFLQALSHLKRGEVNECVDWFLENVEFDPYIDREFKGTTLFSLNKSVDEFNLKALAKLDTELRSYKRVVEGKAGPLLSNVPEIVDLKIGSLVTILSNNWKKGYANGDLAYVMEFFGDKVKVELLRNGEEKIIEYNSILNENSTGKTIGTIKYIPLRLANSITVNRSQGLSLDAVQINLTRDDLNFMSRLHGSLYTAVSRCRTKQGLRIVGTRASFIKACKFDEVYKQMIY